MSKMISFKQFINESIPFREKRDGLYFFTVDGQEMEVAFEDDGEISFGFPHREFNKFEPTRTNKNHFKIINTVANIVNQHTKNAPSGTKYMFVANGKKAAIYQQLLRKFEADRNWNIKVKDHGYGVSVRLEKK